MVWIGLSGPAALRKWAPIAILFAAVIFDAPNKSSAFVLAPSVAHSQHCRARVHSACTGPQKPANQPMFRTGSFVTPVKFLGCERIGEARCGGVLCLRSGGDETGACKVKEGSLTTRGCKIWYKAVHPAEGRERENGGAPALPVVILHGGPGIPHDYLEPLSGLANGDGARTVFFYDQLGSGNSDSPADEEFYSVEQCAQDVVTTLEHLSAHEGLAEHGGFHLFGHSWGGCLATEMLLRHASSSSLVGSKLASVTLASTPTGPDAAMDAGSHPPPRAAAARAARRARADAGRGGAQHAR